MARDKQYKVRAELNVLIPISDGIQLTGDLFCPDTPGRFPALVSYYPYRKDDIIGAHFLQANRYLAEHGYASLLVDFRGLGGSEGTSWEEFDPREGRDGAEIVEWVAGQAWCNGQVGAWGMSYGGTTALQMAAQRPPHLKAAVAMNANVDLYHELVYPGGCFCPLERIGTWGASMIASSLLPPLHEDPDGRWYRVWMERLASLPPPMAFPFKDHPAYDSHWREKVVDVTRIQVPTFIVTGWRDQCPERMIDAYCKIGAPRRLLVGPWGHWMPDRAAFAQVDYLAEIVRWFDAWLANEDNGVESEPRVTIYVQGFGWRHESDWPIPGHSVDQHLADQGALTRDNPTEERSVVYQGNATVGISAGVFPAANGLGLPADQGPDDQASLTFTSEPLQANLEITGTPVAIVHVAVDEGDDLNLVAKICDVSAEGSSVLVTSGWFRASHRLSHQTPSPPMIGDFLEYAISLSATSYLMKKGHRLRLCIATSDFPRIFPSATNPKIRVAFGGEHGSYLRLPVVSSTGVPGPDLPVPDPRINRTPLNIDGGSRYSVDRDFAAGTVTVSIGGWGILRSVDLNGRVETDTLGQMEVQAERPATARVHGRSVFKAKTQSGSVVVAEGNTWLSQTGQIMSGRVTIDGRAVFEKQWQSTRSAGPATSPAKNGQLG